MLHLWNILIFFTFNESKNSVLSIYVKIFIIKTDIKFYLSEYTGFVIIHGQPSTTMQNYFIITNCTTGAPNLNYERFRCQAFVFWNKINAFLIKGLCQVLSNYRYFNDLVASSRCFLAKNKFYLTKKQSSKIAIFNYYWIKWNCQQKWFLHLLCTSASNDNQSDDNIQGLKITEM